MMNDFVHVSVMLHECIEGLSIKENGIYVDCTAGGGGHSAAIAAHLRTGQLISLDQDEEAIKACRARLSVFGERSIVVRENFCRVGEVLRQLDIDAIDGALMDLGVSSYQLDTPERGFSYMADAPLDMRMDQRSTLSAHTIVNTYSEAELRSIIADYGEERFASRIARRIAEKREIQPIETTGELVDLIREAMPASARAEHQHPAKRTFQALRIAVNRELDVITPAIDAIAARLRPGGRCAVITFHSLEDRLVKAAFNTLASGCTCPPDFPVCVCGKKPKVKVMTKKPILPSAEEIGMNPRSRSAKLRIMEKLPL